MQSYNWPTIQLISKTHNICIRREAGKVPQLVGRYFSGFPCFSHEQNTQDLFSFFLGYCGIQYQAYSATSPDSYALDDVTITAVNVSRVRPH